MLLGGAALLLLIAGFQIFGGRDERLARMSASDGRVEVAGVEAAPAADIDRQGSPEITYQVVLHDAPLAGRLDLSCEWVDPGGRVSLHNRYRTRIVYKRTWPTHCRQRFHAGAAAGAWRVRLLSGRRVLSSSQFVLR